MFFFFLFLKFGIGLYPSLDLISPKLLNLSVPLSPVGHSAESRTTQAQIENHLRRRGGKGPGLLIKVRREKHQKDGKHPGLHTGAAGEDPGLTAVRGGRDPDLGLINQTAGCV